MSKPIKEIVIILEGYGDVQALPALIARIGAATGCVLLANKPIRAGEWKSLLRPGRLEKNLDLAATRGLNNIVVILDLDDGCVKTEQEVFHQRVGAWKNGREINVQVVFFNREYETLFLQCPSCLPSIKEDSIPLHPIAIRGAKERLKQIIGRRYRETQDQLSFTKSLDLNLAYQNSRAFRKLCRDARNATYDETKMHFQ